MRSFNESAKAKKLGKRGNKGGQQSTTAAEGGKEPSQGQESGATESDGSPVKPFNEMDSVMQARENLKRKFSRSQTQGVKKGTQLLENQPEEDKNDTPSKPRRNWVTVTDKVDKKAMDRVNVNEDESA
mmetsp:Transcript_10656/g.14353  ORF Transcript_10656/g.14353 Transcript_10656/m.14353 type:complete len:128 (+) Transcript_10656:434-817(+)